MLTLYVAKTLLATSLKMFSLLMSADVRLPYDTRQGAMHDVYAYDILKSHDAYDAYDAA